MAEIFDRMKKIVEKKESEITLSEINDFIDMCCAVAWQKYKIFDFSGNDFENLIKATRIVENQNEMISIIEENKEEN